MPVAKGHKFDIRSAVILGGVAVVAALVIGLIAVSLGQRSGRLVLGDVDFSSLNTDNMAEEIDDGGPILWPDIGTGSRDIWLQHLGDEPGSGWYAFDARIVGVSRECNVVWDPDTNEFENPCTEVRYPADGAGLPQIPIFLDQRRLIIDINGLRTADEFVGYR